ncbi:serine/threonine protein kinase, CMGC, dual-specificity [Hypoxylon texense]
MDMCKCRATVRNQPCVLAEILTAIAKNQLRSTLAKMTASSTRCDNALHLEVFDSLIATYEKQERTDEALKSAAKMINLCPREPKTLCKQRDKVRAFAKFDPLVMLPIELVRIIFNHVDFMTQCGSLRVSKTWKTLLTSPDCRDIWQIQQYNLRNASHPGLSRLRKAFSAYAEYAKKGTTVLSINGSSLFFEKLGLFEVLSYSKTLKVLQLREPYGLRPYQQQHLAALPRLQLTSLYLGLGVHWGPEHIRRLLEATSNTLEELSIFNLPQAENVEDLWCSDWPRLEKLKVARLSRSEQAIEFLLMKSFMHLTPNLEEAWLDHVAYVPRRLVVLWPKLQSLFIGEHAICLTRSEDLSLEPSLHEDLRELHLEGRRLDKRIHIPHLEKLEKLSLLFHEELTDRDFERIVRPSMESGTLRELDVRPLPHKIFFPHILNHRPLPDWLHSDSIEYMSVTGPAAPGLEFNSNFEAVMPDVIERFPNLRVVDIGDYNMSDSVLAHWIRNGVNTVYHRSGYRRADIQEWAAKEHGARFVDGPPRHIPSMRPDRDICFNHLIRAFQINYQAIPTR